MEKLHLVNRDKYNFEVFELTGPSRVLKSYIKEESTLRIICAHSEEGAIGRDIDFNSKKDALREFFLLKLENLQVEIDQLLERR